MNTNLLNSLRLLALGCLNGAVLELSAAQFNSGSDGSYGPMNVTSATVLDVPSNGVFNCTTISINFAGYYDTLTFRPNALNTPVYLLATGDVTITGPIYLGGSDAGTGSSPGVGGPGGFAGGFGGSGGQHFPGGDGAGPGGGKNVTGGRDAVFALAQANNTNTYGNALLVPLLGGSGGAGLDSSTTSYNYGGGGGGGAIVIASNTKITVNSSASYYYGSGIYSLGGAGKGGSGAGSGGSIRLVAPLVAGAGLLTVTPGGRIRIDSQNVLASRSLATAGSVTRGSEMYVLPPLSNRLDIVQAAGQMIPLGITNAVTVSLPFGAATNQSVTLRAVNFTNDIAIRIVVTPDTGPSQVFDGIIANTANPVTNAFNVIIPAGTISRIDAWTR